MKLEDFDLRKLNSLTKYPSIPTYHTMGNKGVLQPETVDFSNVGNVNITEKIDGTNARIIILPDNTYIIGSREELLYAQGDKIINPALQIVETLKDSAERLTYYRVFQLNNSVKVLYGECYGGKITKASKRYTDDGATNYRLFDICEIDDLSVLDRELSEISSWRENGGQTFKSQNDLHKICVENNIVQVPYIDNVKTIPIDIGETFEFLKCQIVNSHANINAEEVGLSEGIIVRSDDRSAIAKIRYDDYNRWERFNKKR